MVLRNANLKTTPSLRVEISPDVRIIIKPYNTGVDLFFQKYKNIAVFGEKDNFFCCMVVHIMSMIVP